MSSREQTDIVEPRKSEQTPSASLTDSGNEVLLFKTATCPRCREAEEALRTKNVNFRPVYADDPSMSELVRKYRVMTAPTLVAGDTTLRGLSDILGWINNR